MSCITEWKAFYFKTVYVCLFANGKILFTHAPWIPFHPFHQRHFHYYINTYTTKHRFSPTGNCIGWIIRQKRIFIPKTYILFQDCINARDMFNQVYHLQNTNKIPIVLHSYLIQWKIEWTGIDLLMRSYLSDRMMWYHFGSLEHPPPNPGLRGSFPKLVSRPVAKGAKGPSHFLRVLSWLEPTDRSEWVSKNEPPVFYMIWSYHAWNAKYSVSFGCPYPFVFDKNTTSVLQNIYVW